jgi:hypothetical protein
MHMGKSSALLVSLCDMVRTFPLQKEQRTLPGKQAKVALFVTTVIFMLPTGMVISCQMRDTLIFRSNAMELWIGLAGLKANPDCKNFKRFGEGKGAYVHIAAWADSREVFEERVRKAAEELDCILYDLDDVSTLDSRMNAPDYPEEFLDMRKTAINRPDDTVFGAFHIWQQEDAN